MGFHNQTKIKFVTFHITAGDKKIPIKKQSEGKIEVALGKRTSVLTKKPQLT